jgi:hypothetical protein
MDHQQCDLRTLHMGRGLIHAQPIRTHTESGSGLPQPVSSDDALLDRSQRDALLAGREDEVANIEALLFRHDPIGINFDDNTDEYRPEAQTITLRRGEARTLPDVRSLVHREFNRWFGDTAGPESTYEDLARELHCYWNKEFVHSRSTLVGTGELLRVWSLERGDRLLHNDEIGIEWCGRAGHPSSYALLVGRRVQANSAIALRYQEQRQFHGSLAGICDEVHWGLSDEYREPALKAFGPGIEVTIAAQGEIGSSIRAFERAGKMLRQLLTSHHDEGDVWPLWRTASAE